MRFLPLCAPTLVLALSCTARVTPTGDDHHALTAIATHPELRGHVRALGGERLRIELPSRARQPLRIARLDRPGFAAEITALVDDAAAVSQHDALVFPGVARDTSLVFEVGPSAVEELRVLDSADAPALLRWKISRGPDVATVRIREGRIELVDASGYVGLASAPMFLVDAAGIRREIVPSLQGDVVEARLDLDGLRFPVVVDPVWSSMPPMKDARHYHASVTLGDGRVLVAGGNSSVTGGPISAAEIFDPKTNTWSSTGALTEARAAHRAVIVRSGVLGGRPIVVGSSNSTAESYDLLAGTFASIASMAAPKPNLHLLSVTSFVLAISGPSIERWNSYGNTWDTLPGPTGAPVLVQAVAMKDNRILIVHTMKDYTTQDCLDRVEILDPIATPATLTAAAPLPTKRCIGSLTLLNDGKVLAAGGSIRDTSYSQVEVYDPTANTWKSVKSKPAYKGGHRAAVLGSGRVLFMGGYVTDPMNVVSEIYDPVTDAWTGSIPWPTGRILYGFNTLNNGGVLVSGGNTMSTSTKNAEIFDEGGNTCTKNEDCPARFCVDGVCCDRACDGQCEACNVAGSVGTCTAVVGAPHGMRTACDNGGGDTCKAKVCDGKDAKTCAAFAPTTTECKPASCTDATFTAAAKCDGAGACAATTSKSCAPFNCTTAGCVDACNSTAECAKGLVCKSRACVPGCSTDGTKAVAPTGEDVSCNAYLCDPVAGACRTTCTSSSECAAGNVCDLATKTCAPQATDGGDDGGCTYGATGSETPWLVALLALALRIRARRASDRTRHSRGGKCSRK